MKGQRMHKKRLSAPERHAIEAALKGKIVSVTLQEEGAGWTATVEVEEDGE